VCGGEEDPHCSTFGHAGNPTEMMRESLVWALSKEPRAAEEYFTYEMRSK
jgi:hypothetical protein